METGRYGGTRGSRPVGPGVSWLRQHAERGITQTKMVDLWEQESGYRVSRSAIAMAMRRYNVDASRPRPTHDELLPWKVKTEHQMRPEARLLRLESRRRKGQKLTEENLLWLTNWRKQLIEMGAVVHYDPDTEEGFFLVPREPQDDDLIRSPK